MLLNLFYFSCALTMFPFLNLFKNFTVADLFFLLLFILLTLKKKLKYDRPIFFTSILLLTGILISELFVNDLNTSIVPTLQYIYIFFILYPVFNTLVTNMSIFKNILKIYSYTSALTVIYALLVNNLTVKTIQGRYFSVYQNAWIFSMVTIMGVALSLFLTTQASNLKNKFFPFIALLINILGVFISGSRTGFLVSTMILAGYIYFLLSKKIKNIYTKLLVNIIFITTILMSLLSFTSIISSFTRLISPYNSNFSEKLMSLTQLENADQFRQQMYANGIENISNSPFIGMGIGNYAQSSSGIGMAMHNFYLSIWLEIGLLGLISMLLLSYLSFKRTLTVTDPTQKHLLIVTMIAFLIIITFNPILTLRIYWLPVFYFLLSPVLNIKTNHNFRSANPK